MSSPLLWGPNSTAINLQNQELLATGELIQNNGPQNLIGYNNFENGLTTGWSLGTTGALTNGLPTATPTFGSGTTSLAISATSTTPIHGGFSLAYTASAITTVGNMVASDPLVVNTALQAKVLTFKFWYQCTSGASNANFSGTSSNSFGVACYDVTNSSWLPVAGNFAMTQGVGVGIATGTMQTNATTASIRFVIYNVAATGGAVTMYFDDLYLGPLTAPLGAVIADQAWTTTAAGLGTLASQSCSGYRDGRYFVGEYSVVSGANTGTVVQLSLPTGLTIDITLYSGNYQVGTGATNATPFTHNVLVATGSTTSGVFLTTTGASFTTGTPGTTWANSTTFSGSFRVPISGWTTNVQTSSDTDTRVIASEVNTLSSTTGTAGTAFIFNAINFDLNGAVIANGVYKVPVSGVYDVSFAGLASSATTTDLGIFVNGVARIGRTATAVSGGARVCFSLPVVVNAGDLITIVPTVSFTAVDTTVTASFVRRSGPAVIAATESVNARYFASATSLSGSLATIVWTTKDFDSHNAMSSGTYTAPVSGKYQVNTALALSGTFALNNQSNLVIQKNGSTVSELLDYAAGAETADHVLLSDIISCNAGDTLRVQCSSGATVPTIVSSNTKNYISISRVGN